MALCKILLKGFEFPPRLSADHANFRFVFLLRHLDVRSETWTTVESVSPGLSTYWECDPDRQENPGKGGKPIRDGANARFKEPVPWDQTVLMMNTSELFQLRVVVIDVNREDWVDVLRGLGEALVGAVFGLAKGIALPSVIGAPVGTLLEQVRTSVIDAMARKDRTLFAADYQFGTDQTSQDLVLEKAGYRIRLHLDSSQARPQGIAARDLARGSMVPNSAFARVIVDGRPESDALRPKRARKSRNR
jgi:hypothetical protein